MRFPMLGTKVTGSTSIALTEPGKRMAEKYSSRGPTFTILAALSEKSPMTVSELAMETQIEISEAKQRIKLLSKQGLLRVSGNEA